MLDEGVKTICPSPQKSEYRGIKEQFKMYHNLIVSITR